MSLKWFHLVFISASVALAILLGVWSFMNGLPLLGLVGLVLAGTLIAYRTRFLETARRIGLK
jgi:hypothetical protein